MPETPQVQSVARAFEILEALSGAPNGLGLAEVARAVVLKQPTVHNLLRTLVARSYARQDPATQRYHVGHGCASLGRSYLRSLRVPDASRAPIESLARRLNESVVVGAIEGGEIAFVARAAGEQMLAVNFESHWQRVDYGSVCGRVILAYLSEDELEIYVKRHPIAGRAADITSRRDLDAILRRARKDGHLEYWRENHTVYAIAAPVRDHAGRVVAAVGVGMPGVRFSKKERPRLVAAVMETADEISKALGYAAPAREPAAVRG